MQSRKCFLICWTKCSINDAQDSICLVYDLFTTSALHNKSEEIRTPRCFTHSIALIADPIEYKGDYLSCLWVECIHSHLSGLNQVTIGLPNLLSDQCRFEVLKYHFSCRQSLYKPLYPILYPVLLQIWQGIMRRRCHALLPVVADLSKYFLTNVAGYSLFLIFQF